VTLCQYLAFGRVSERVLHGVPDIWHLKAFIDFVTGKDLKSMLHNHSSEREDSTTYKSSTIIFFIDFFIVNVYPQRII